MVRQELMRVIDASSKRVERDLADRFRYRSEHLDLREQLFVLVAKWPSEMVVRHHRAAPLLVVHERQGA